MTTKIYGLAHPESGRVRYVGKCVTKLRVRLASHLYKARSGRTRTPSGDWIRQLQHRGLKPTIVLLEEVVEGRWQDAERRWIAKLRAEGRRLLNQHPGGNGAHTRASLPAALTPLLGEIADSRIASMAGLCRETITYHRRRAGITASHDHSQDRPGPGRSRLVMPDDIRARLGTVGDAKLAAEWGVSRGTVTARRKELGVAEKARDPRRGSGHPNSKLTSTAAADIRASYQRGTQNYGVRALAEKYGVDPSTIQAVLKGDTWV
jgi:hypothetical protein